MKYLLILLLFIFVPALHAQNFYSKDKNHFQIDYLIGEKEEYETPCFILRSDKEYPKVVIDACIHGDEIAGAIACDSVMKYINIYVGTVVFIPKVNIKAYNTSVRGVNVDLNQVFPGNKESTLYEEKLAFDFMQLIEDLEPDLVVNLHEAWTKFDDYKYSKQNDKSFGQTIITNKDTFPEFLTGTLDKINSEIKNKENYFRIQYFPYKPNHSMDNIIEKLQTPSYTVETLRTLPLEERIDYQVTCILAFSEERE